ncbi:hypothetical protein AVEN_129731-1 [Araneus ventricosus]|uniref:Uncharacterized protein n=1 Tax=Araneus ventricosus TaxID=182803 RepID=A0A4Y2JBA5_ARAVE|nr:hypothetical protein AVEN_129731-1 [Araneus ventricosus]
MTRTTPEMAPPLQTSAAFEPGTFELQGRHLTICHRCLQENLKCAAYSKSQAKNLLKITVSYFVYGKVIKWQLVPECMICVQIYA